MAGGVKQSDPPADAYHYSRHGFYCPYDDCYGCLNRAQMKKLEGLRKRVKCKACKRPVYPEPLGCRPAVVLALLIGGLIAIMFSMVLLRALQL